MRKKRRIALTVSAVLILALVLGCGLYVSDYYRADEVAAAALVSDMVTVTLSEDRAVFAPEDPIAGLIFYPGGKVEFTAYAPLMHALAEEGVACVLLKMPCNLAVLDVNAAEGIAGEFPEIDRWYLAGHSLGGSMAASYAAEHAQQLDGLILLAAYSTADLTESDLAVLSLYGDRDQVLNREKYEQYRGNLPETTVEVVIEGGNHAGFGSYGSQEGDGEAALSQQEQIAFTTAQIREFLQNP